jgi:hypothetical protein
VNSTATLGTLPGHALAAARPGADQDEAPDKARVLQRDQLCHLAAHRVADQVNCAQAEDGDEPSGISSHRVDGAGGGAAARPDACIVEQHDLAPAGEGVADRRVEVLQVAHEVLDEN